jgi:hypothetical protein
VELIIVSLLEQVVEHGKQMMIVVKGVVLLAILDCDRPTWQKCEMDSCLNQNYFPSTKFTQNAKYT